MNDNTCDIGLLGLGVMGKNFALNMADKGFRIRALVLSYSAFFSHCFWDASWYTIFPRSENLKL